MLHYAESVWRVDRPRLNVNARAFTAKRKPSGVLTSHSGMRLAIYMLHFWRFIHAASGGISLPPFLFPNAHVVQRSYLWKRHSRDPLFTPETTSRSLEAAKSRGFPSPFVRAKYSNISDNSCQNLSPRRSISGGWSLAYCHCIFIYLYI